MGFANSVSEQWQRAFEVKTDQWINWPKQRENCSRSKLTDILVLSRCFISSPVLLAHTTLTFTWPSSFPPACLKQKCMVKVHLNQQRFGRVPRDDPLVWLWVPQQRCAQQHTSVFLMQPRYWEQAAVTLVLTPNQHSCSNLQQSDHSNIWTVFKGLCFHYTCG